MCTYMSAGCASYSAAFLHYELRSVRLTAGVTRKWAGVDAVWRREKLEARKRLEKRADSHLSGARIVRHTHRTPTDLIYDEYQTHLENIVPTSQALAITKKDFGLPKS
jgi:hypothetical protein